MVMFRKDYNLKIVTLLTAILFSVNNIAYGIDLSEKNHLRKPLDFSKKKTVYRYSNVYLAFDKDGNIKPEYKEVVEKARIRIERLLQESDNLKIGFEPEVVTEYRNVKETEKIPHEVSPESINKVLLINDQEKVIQNEIFELLRFNGVDFSARLDSGEPLEELLQEPSAQDLITAWFKRKTADFKYKLDNGWTSDDILIEAFAVVREATRLTIGKRHYDVEVLAGVNINERKKAVEMYSGEGKTLTAVFPLYLKALTGKGVHLHTWNDYLACRDAQITGPIFDRLGLSVGAITIFGNDGYGSSYLYDSKPHRLRKQFSNLKNLRTEHTVKEARRRAYKADITYGPGEAFIFDYLRDNLISDLGDRVQRVGQPAKTIVDEGDDVLIDGALSPLFIGIPEEVKESIPYHHIYFLAKDLFDENSDYARDRVERRVFLTNEGKMKVKKLLEKSPTLRELGVSKLNMLFEVALTVKPALNPKKSFYREDKEYIKRDNEVIIVDEHTGRLREGCTWSMYLQQFVEIAAGTPLKRRASIWAIITRQNYYRMLDDLSIMTGTIGKQAGEFYEVYDLDSVWIPLNKPLKRTDYEWVLYRTNKERARAVVEDVVEMHKKGRPVSVVTRHIDETHYLASLLDEEGIEYQILDGTDPQKEATKVAKAGQRAMVTIATNVAGRGTDILLGEGVEETGGLHQISAQDQRSGRMHKQVQCRAGRHGESGSSRIFLSLEDELLSAFGGKKIEEVFNQTEDLGPGRPIENIKIRKLIEDSQQRIEEHDYAKRQEVLRYDNILSEKRELFYLLRDIILHSEKVKDKIDRLKSMDSSWRHYLRELEQLKEEGVNIEDYKLLAYNKFLKILSSSVNGKAEGPLTYINAKQRVESFLEEVEIMPLPPGGVDLLHELAEKEKELILWSLDQAGGNKTWAAKLLGIARVVLKDKITKLNLQVPSFVANEGAIARRLREKEKDLILRALKQTEGKKVPAARLLGISHSNLWYRMKRLRLEQVVPVPSLAPLSVGIDLVLELQKAKEGFILEQRRNLNSELIAAEKGFLEKALRQSGRDKDKASKLLKISRHIVDIRIAKYGLEDLEYPQIKGLGLDEVVEKIANDIQITLIENALGETKGRLFETAEALGIEYPVLVSEIKRLGLVTSGKLKFPPLPADFNFKSALNDAEKRFILMALKQTNWNRRQAAKLLEIGTTTLYEKIKQYDLKLEDVKIDVPLLPEKGINLIQEKFNLKENFVLRALHQTHWNIGEAAGLLGIKRQEVTYYSRKFGMVVLEPERMDLREGLKEAERNFISRAMRQAGGIKTEAAKLLKISLPNIFDRANRIGLDLEEASKSNLSPLPIEWEGLRVELKKIEKRIVSDALQSAGGHQAMAAKALGLTRHTVSKKIRELDIEIYLKKPKVDSILPSDISESISDFDTKAPRSCL